MREKHKKKFTTPIQESVLQTILHRLKEVIMTLSYKQQHLLGQWIQQWGSYLSNEKEFDPNKLRYYKRGEILLVDFGYNVGSELGGIHYAVVVESNNNKASGQIVVIPISSMEKGVGIDKLHKSEVYLGKAIGDVESYAKTLQIRAISKQRIRRPKYSGQHIGRISSATLSEIDKRIEMFLLRKK